MQIHLKKCYCKILAGVLCCLAPAETKAQAPAPELVAHPAASSVTMEASAAEGIKIKLGGKFVCNGNWAPMAVDGPLAADQVPLGVLVSAGFEKKSENHATFVDVYTSAKAETTAVLQGEDLSLRTHLQNLDTKHALVIAGLHGLTFHFAKPAAGTIPAWHPSYLSAKGDDICYPGNAQPLGAVHAHDDQFGFCVFSNDFDHMRLFNATWRGDGFIPAECSVDFYTHQVVLPGQSVDIDAVFRISSDFSIPHLFENYKKAYTAHFPKLLYEPDSRPMGQFAAADKTHITASNPLGYNGDFRRLDTDKGVRTYVAAIAPWLYKAEAVGIIFWSPGGYDPPMYPPDFDEFPSSVQQNIPKLVEGFKSYDLRVGLCARCGDGVTREEGKEPVIYRLNANDPDQMKTLMARFDHARQMGFDMFYLDSFGAEGMNDLNILKQIRAKVGPKVLLYTELCTDQSLAYAGHYCEWDGGSLLWTSGDQYAVMRYLQPDSTWLCKSRAKEGPNPPVFEKMGLTPLVEDSEVNRLPSKRPFK
jgi:hypothetical protein